MNQFKLKKKREFFYLNINYYLLITKKIIIFKDILF